jgi:MFS family permease
MLASIWEDDGHFGRGPGPIVSNMFFAAGNLICGLAQDEGTMIAGRVIAGIGGGGPICIATFLGSDIPPRKRGATQGIGCVCYSSGPMLGGILGGIANKHTQVGWRLPFLIEVPPAILCSIAVPSLSRYRQSSLTSRTSRGSIFWASFS